LGALTRLYSHHMRAAIARLKAENTELRRKLIDAAARASMPVVAPSPACARTRCWRHSSDPRTSRPRGR